MIRTAFSLIISAMATTAMCQAYTSSAIFAHNDYIRDVPFYTAYDLGVGFIEADVFLEDGDLLVAHHKREIEKAKNLEVLYLEPLLKQVKKNEGFVYESQAQRLTLMIDLKTEGVSTLNKIVEQLKKFPELTACRTLQFMISGSVPDPALWKNYPSFIYFDGRPGIAYTPDQLRRVSMISTSFGAHVKWDGKTALAASDSSKIANLIYEAHEKGKPMRFWATPDFNNAWREQMRLKMDVIVTDDVAGLSAFLKKQ